MMEEKTRQGKSTGECQRSEKIAHELIGSVLINLNLKADSTD
jgi:hypothetical protein